MTQLGVPAEELKQCCAIAYESPWARLLLGESFHPGGLKLTTRVGKLLELGSGRHLLDVASGLGTSAVHLAHLTGCRVTGADLSPTNVAFAGGEAEKAGVAHLVEFRCGDAEQLPFSDKAFDAVLCECAFCTFPSKAAAARELRRVLRPGGLVAISDLTAAGELPPELTTLLGWVSCLADARPVSEYVAELEFVGLRATAVENHDYVLRELVRSMRLKLLAAEAMIKLGKLDLPLAELKRAKGLLKAASAVVADGRLGYTVIVARR